MADLGNFNASTVESLSFDVIPPGYYIAMATESDKKATKAGSGTYLQFTFSILDGEHKGRKLWARMTYENKSEMAMKIGASDLKHLCEACGVQNPGTTERLHNIPIMLKVVIEKRSDNGEDTNTIKGYSPITGTGQPVAAPAAAAPQVNSAGGRPPWR